MKTVSKEVFVLSVVLAFFVGMFVVYALLQPSRGYYSNDAMQGTASMMNDRGNMMMQMGKMMMSSGVMMAQKGERYKDSEMMQTGRELEEKGIMMQTGGSELLGRGSYMAQMMGLE